MKTRIIDRNTTLGAKAKFEFEFAERHPFVILEDGVPLSKNGRIRRYVDRPAAERAIVSMDAAAANAKSA